MRKSVIIGTKTTKYKIRASRKPLYTNQNQRRKFLPRLAKKLDKEEIETFTVEPQLPQDLHNFITNTITIQQFVGFKTLVPSTLLCVTHDKPVKFYQRFVILNDQTYYSILNHSIN